MMMILALMILILMMMMMNHWADLLSEAQFGLTSSCGKGAWGGGVGS
jgi:hypothetical protein